MDSKLTNLQWELNFKRSWIDKWLVTLIVLLVTTGLCILYSASGQNHHVIFHQTLRFGLALAVMVMIAQIPPRLLYQWTPTIYTIALIMLIAVLIIGHVSNGAQRWLQIAQLRLQPSELMKLVVPMIFARYFHDKPLPADNTTHWKASFLAVGPILATAVEPDLGTALMLAAAAATILFLAGLRWRTIIIALTALLMALPIFWHFLQPYQKSRVLTFLNPSRDPLGSGYHIIQSKIAIGSGGLIGKGWLQSTQSHLNFLPEDTTDFIFAVVGEEFGLAGASLIILLFLLITFRGLYICYHAQDTYTRLLAGGLIVIFFLSAFVNMGMVIGLLPVVGLPLPLVSYGGTSMVTLMASLGVLMAIHNHRQLLTH